MTPETWLPTWTVVTAESVPVAVTVMVTLPRSTFSVLYCSSFLPPPLQANSDMVRSSVVAVRRRFTFSPRNTTGGQPSLKRAKVYRMLRRHFSRSTETNGPFLQRTHSRSAFGDAPEHDPRATRRDPHRTQRDDRGNRVRFR